LLAILKIRVILHHSEWLAGEREVPTTKRKAQKHLMQDQAFSQREWCAPLVKAVCKESAANDPVLP
jgi:hypothetical protein